MDFRLLIIKGHEKLIKVVECDIVISFQLVDSVYHSLDLLILFLSLAKTTIFVVSQLQLIEDEVIQIPDIFLVFLLQQ